MYNITNMTDKSYRFLEFALTHKPKNVVNMCNDHLTLYDITYINIKIDTSMLI
jgi:hypothetical protein